MADVFREVRDRIRALSRRISAIENRPMGVDMLLGDVTASNLAAAPKTVTIRFDPDSTPVPGIPYQDWYNPVVGDKVMVLRQGAAYFCLGDRKP